MSLRDLAAADLGAILENTSDGFGWPITITDPDGLSGSLTGMSGDISTIIDPDTGLVVSGRHATATVTLQALTNSGLAVPYGIADNDSKPWTVVFDDVQGNAYTFRVYESQPDRTLGYVNMILEAWTP